MWNIFKVNNKDTRTTPLASFWCLYSKLWTYFTPFSMVSIASFELVNADLENSKCFTNFETLDCSLMFIKEYFSNSEPSRFQHFNLNNFSPLFHFYSLWKRQKRKGFLMFSWGITMEHWVKDGTEIFTGRRPVQSHRKRESF